MRKLVLKMSVSRDGFVCGPNGEIDWMFKSMSKEGAAWTAQKVGEAGAHLMGRKTFYDMASYWPNSSEVFAGPMNEIPKIVFSEKGFDPSQIGESSRALIDATRIEGGEGANMVSALPPSAKSWAEATVVTGDLAAGIAHLKAEPGKPLVVQGGASFGQALVLTGLIDEFWLVRHPVAIGKGLGLFARLHVPMPLELVDTKVFDAGACFQIFLRSE
jgi:dihydrofolate reductase